jgi:hypothetical protein
MIMSELAALLPLVQERVAADRLGEAVRVDEPGVREDREHPFDQRRGHLLAPVDEDPQARKVPGVDRRLGEHEVEHHRREPDVRQALALDRLQHPPCVELGQRTRVRA